MRKETINYQNNLINIDEAVERLGGDKPFLFELLNDFIGDFYKYLNELQKEISEENSGKIYVIGHTVKGASAILSLTQIRDLSFQLEKAGKEKDINKAKDIHGKLSYEYGRLVDFYKEKIEKIN